MMYMEIFNLMYSRRKAKWNMNEGHKWFLTSNWKARTKKLYAVAGEAAQKVKN